MVFRGVAATPASDCPRCHRESHGSTGDAITWYVHVKLLISITLTGTSAQCGIYYRRLQELPKNYYFVNLSKNQEGLPSVFTTKGSSPPRNPAIVDTSSNTGMISNFRRVQLIVQTIMRSPNAQSAKIFVGNLWKHTTSRSLTEVFSRFGEVVEAVVVKDEYMQGTNEGVGYVTFREPINAQYAVDHMNSVQLDGRTMWVDFARRNKKANHRRGSYRHHIPRLYDATAFISETRSVEECISLYNQRILAAP